MAGIIGTETRHPPLLRIRRHAHDLQSIYIVLEGNLTEYADRSERDLGTYGVTFTPAGTIHSNPARHASGIDPVSAIRSE